MTASVGLDREGGNSLLKFKETNTLNMSSMHHDLTKAQHAGLVNWVLFINTPFKVKDWLFHNNRPNKTLTTFYILTYTMSTLGQALQTDLEAGMGSLLYNLYRRPQRQCSPLRCHLQRRPRSPWRLSDWVSSPALLEGFDQAGHSWPKASCPKVWGKTGNDSSQPDLVRYEDSSHSKWHQRISRKSKHQLCLKF